LVEYTVWSTVPTASVMTTRNSCPGSAKAVAAFWMRSCQLRVAWVTVAGTTKGWLMLRIPPTVLFTTSNAPARGARGVAGPGGAGGWEAAVVPGPVPGGRPRPPARVPRLEVAVDEEVAGGRVDQLTADGAAVGRRPGLEAAERRVEVLRGRAGVVRRPTNRL